MGIFPYFNSARRLGCGFLDRERKRNMSSRLALSTWRLCAVGAAALALAAVWSPLAVSAATPNVCHITGVTRAVAKKVFPKLSGVSASQTEEPTTPPNFGVCDVTPRPPAVTSLEVELWSASAFQQQTVTFTNSGKLQRLRGLGHSAFYSPVKGNKNEGNVLFERGAYTVLIDPTRIGGTSALYPTEKQYVTLARAIYKHLG
jgi:hypothetical protein